MTYIGNNTTVSQYAPQVAYFSGTGSQTVFTLPQAVVSAAQIIVVVANVIQNPSSAYTVSGTTLTFTSAPPTGTNNIWVEYTSLQTNTVAPSTGTVNTSSFGSVTSIPFTGYNSIGTGNSSAMKNRIINGAMVIDQRNSGSSVTPAGGSSTYTLDRFYIYASQASKLTVQQNAGSVTPPVGFTKYLGVTSSSAYSVLSSDVFVLSQPIEGLNIFDLAWGTANAKTITLSFQVYSSLTGTFGGCLRNGANNRSYPFTYTVSSANTWTSISVTVAGDITGTWATDNSTGMYVFWGLGVGSSNSGTAGSWSGGTYASATSAVSVVGTNGATFYITGVQLEVGLAATGFEYRQYGTELALCQRYYQSVGNNVLTSGLYVAGGGLFMSHDIFFKTTMRTSPTVTLTNVTTFNGGTPAVNTVTTDAFQVGFGSSAGTWSNSTSGFTATAEL
jgi:hypothetical protein